MKAVIQKLADEKTADEMSLTNLVTAMVLAVLSLSTLVHQFLGSSFGLMIARWAFLALCLCMVSRFSVREWVLTLLAFTLAVGLLVRNHDLPAILFALDRAAFFAAFIYLVTLLKEAAQRSASVLDLGLYTTRQPRGRRYYGLAVGGHILGVLLNFGAVSLLTPLIQRGARKASEDTLAVRRAEQQQISALLRGFSWMIMWSPTALTQAVLFTTFPSIDQSVTIVLGISAAVIMILIGRFEDRLRWRNTQLPTVLQSQDLPMSSALRFGIICALLIGLTFGVLLATGVSAAIALMLVAPVLMVAWICGQQFKSRSGNILGSTIVIVCRILSQSSISMGRSAFMLGAGGFIGEAAAKLAPVDLVAHSLEHVDMPDWLFLMALPVLISLAGQIALSPILIVVFLSAIINALPVLPADPNLIVFSLGAGWAMSMTASPNASATLMISGVTNIPPTTLTWRWNGVYALLCYATFSALFAVLAHWFPAPVG